MDIKKGIFIFLLGSLVGAIFPGLFIYLDLNQLDMLVNLENISWVAKSQNSLLFSTIAMPTLFGILALAWQVIIQRTKELRQANKEVSKLAHQAGMAEVASEILHNIGNLLQVLSLNSSRMKRKVLPAFPVGEFEKASKLIETKQEEIEKIKNVDEKLYKLFQFYPALGIKVIEQVEKLDSGLLVIEDKVKLMADVLEGQLNIAKGAALIEEVEPGELMEKAQEILKNSIIKNDVKITRNYNVNFKIKTEVSKVVNVFVNLVKNGIEAMRESDKRGFTLSVEQEGEMVKFSFRDQGSGISHENLKNLFQYGFTTKDDGHGFGLHSCSNLIASLGGKIWAESPGEGEGCTFFVTLPKNR